MMEEKEILIGRIKGTLPGRVLKKIALANGQYPSTTFVPILQGLQVAVTERWP